MKKLTIKVTTNAQGSRYEPVGVEVLDGDTSIGGGGIGGEPEDNCMVRDYAWIVPTMKKLAEHLGADVEVIFEVDPERGPGDSD